MEDFPRKNEGCHQFLDLVPKEKNWLVKTSQVDKKLELSLGPPGGDWTISDNHNSKKNTSSREINHEHFLDFGYFSNNPCVKNPALRSPWPQQQQHGLIMPVMNEPSQPCSNNRDLKVAEKKAFSTPPANTAVPNVSSAQKRTAPAPVVGWPPIRSFRKNIASGSSSKLASESKDTVPTKAYDQKPKENGPKTLFVKINMDGIPIGRKVDLKAYDSYEKLSYAVDELFRGLLAAQSDSCGDEEGKVVGRLLDGNREYTLVYEDNEGDRMLVGDVPWHMFVSTVKRLRVLKSSELPTLSRGAKQGKRLSIDASSK